MPKLPRLSGREAGVVFGKLGYKLRNIAGSHMVFRAPGKKPLSIPDHRELDAGLLRRLIRDAGITPQEFVDLAD